MFIKEAVCISPQNTYLDADFRNFIQHEGVKYFANEPKYSEFIPRGVLRRMGKATKMGIAASRPIIDGEYKIESIILGTGLGGLQEVVLFLNQIIKYNEGTLTPTNFVASTSNAVAGQLALKTKNHGYNITHVNNGHSFENAVVDALLQFRTSDIKQLLLGSVEEISEYNFNIESSGGYYKKDTNFNHLFSSNTPGTISGEGASMYLLSNKKEADAVEIVDTFIFNFPDEEEIVSLLDEFLKKNEITIDAIEGLILGYNGDNRWDHYYDLVKEKFKSTTNLYVFKNAIGEYPTAISYAYWLATKILKGNPIPKEYFSPFSSEHIAKPKTILIYNHFKAKQHSFSLLRI